MGYVSILLKFTEQLMISNGVKHITLNSGIKKERGHALITY